MTVPVPVAVRSKAHVCDRSLPRDCGFESRGGMHILSLVNTVCLRGKGLCEGPILHPQESYRV